MPPLARALVFIGFMGAGKSTAAAEVAAALGVEALDSDLLLEASTGHSIAREFELHGEPAFRAREERLVCELLEQAGSGAAQPVVALGGGAVLSERVRAALAAHLVVLLDVDPVLAWERVQGQGRPLASDRAAFAALHAERRTLYEELADAILPAHLPGVATRALPALRALAAASATGREAGGSEEADGAGAGVAARLEGARRDSMTPRGCCGRRRHRASTRCSSAAGCSERAARRRCGSSDRAARRARGPRGTRSASPTRR